MGYQFRLQDLGRSAAGLVQILYGYAEARVWPEVLLAYAAFRMVRPRFLPARNESTGPVWSTAHLGQEKRIYLLSSVRGFTPVHRGNGAAAEGAGSRRRRLFHVRRHDVPRRVLGRRTRPSGPRAPRGARPSRLPPGAHRPCGLAPGAD